MTPDNYAAIQRNLGILEGLVCSLPEHVQQLAFDTITTIDETIDHIQNREGG